MVQWCNECEHKEACKNFINNAYCIFDFALQYHELVEKILEEERK